MRGHRSRPFSLSLNQIRQFCWVPKHSRPWEASVDWRQLYTAAILTTDPGCIEFVLDEAARAMDLRLDELATTGGDFEERREIAMAAKSLLIKRSEWQESKLHSEG